MRRDVPLTARGKRFVIPLMSQEQIRPLWAFLHELGVPMDESYLDAGPFADVPYQGSVDDAMVLSLAGEYIAVTFDGNNWEPLKSVRSHAPLSLPLYHGAEAHIDRGKMRLNGWDCDSVTLMDVSWIIAKDAIEQAQKNAQPVLEKMAKQRRTQRTDLPLP